jgi:hypothetical protein
MWIACNSVTICSGVCTVRVPSWEVGKRAVSVPSPPGEKRGPQGDDVSRDDPAL